jgi:hypothetical protein
MHPGLVLQAAAAAICALKDLATRLTSDLRTAHLQRLEAERSRDVVLARSADGRRHVPRGDEGDREVSREVRL